MRFFFEDYSFDTDRRELQRGADVIPVASQVFDLLEYLIRNRERQPNFLGAQRMVMASLAMAGRIEEARRVCVAVLQAEPALSISGI